MKRFLTSLLFLLSAIAPAKAAPDVGWEQVGQDSGGTRFSAAEQIDTENVGSLDVAWTYSTGDQARFEAQNVKWKFQATPIFFEGLLVLCTHSNDVVALDPGTGREIWRYEAHLSVIEPTGNGLACRGVTSWRDRAAAAGALCATRIFTGTSDVRLQALDARTGVPCPDFGKNGSVQIDTGDRQSFAGEVQITSPPVVARDTVLVGSAIGDNIRVAAPNGAVRAFDARTGAFRWQFDPVPRSADDPARATWGTGADITGHANVWSLMSADENLGLFYVPTSSPSVDHFGGTRPGANRYSDSVVALDAQSGRVVWHFQTTHHDLWDYDVASQPTLVNLKRDGLERPALIQPTKMGLVFTFDRRTGAPLFEIEERPVPQGDVPGELYSSTQPFPRLPRMLVPDHLKPDEAWGITPWDRAICRDLIAKARYEGIYTPPSVTGSIAYPFISGGANWGSAAFDPKTQTLFLLTNNASGYLQLIPRERAQKSGDGKLLDGLAPMEGTPYVLKRTLLASPFGAPCNPPPWGKIHAVDMATGEIRWERPLGTLEDFVPFGDLLLPHGSGNMGGPIVTAGGLIFVAATMDNYLRALAVDDGRELWKGRLPAGGQATPMTYAWKGRQYVVVAAGGHPVIGTTPGDYVVAFALPPTPVKAVAFFGRPTARWALLFGVITLLGAMFIIVLKRRLRAP